jgi:hypothetical protein
MAEPCVAGVTRSCAGIWPELVPVPAYFFLSDPLRPVAMDKPSALPYLKI